MRAIKINVIDKTVSEIEIEGGYDCMCKELDSNGYDGVRLSKTEYLWVDGEGLLRKPPIGAFMTGNYPQSLSGHGLIIGIDGGGNSVSTKLTVEQVRDMIEFVEVETLPEPKVEFHSFETFEQAKKFLNK